MPESIESDARERGTSRGESAAVRDRLARALYTRACSEFEYEWEWTKDSFLAEADDLLGSIGCLDDEMLSHYSAALDEVYALRRALAYEARVLEAHALDIPRLGKNRREHLERAHDRMQQAARGESERAYAGANRRSMDSAFAEAGAPETLTRAAWEARYEAAPAGRQR